MDTCFVDTFDCQVVGMRPVDVTLQAAFHDKVQHLHILVVHMVALPVDSYFDSLVLK